MSERMVLLRGEDVGKKKSKLAVFNKQERRPKRPGKALYKVPLHERRFYFFFFRERITGTSTVNFPLFFNGIFFFYI